MNTHDTFIQYLISDYNSKDLRIEFCGYHKCEKNHSFGPAVRDCYLLHFCLGGKGCFTNEYGKHHIKNGEYFIIKPDEITTYTADKDDPWEYVWVAFSGKEACIFNKEISVYQTDKNEIIELKNYIQNKITTPSAFKSILYKIIFTLSSQEDYSINIVSKIKQYINFNYMENLSLQNLSKIFGYERTYLYRIFKNSIGTGIKKYVTKIRMEKAKSFLNKGYTVSNTASIVGYNDVFNFSKAYKNYYGHSPKTIKKEP